jgi:hypothetical protein
MLSQALTTSTDMYKENSRVLGLIEDKAQKAAGLAGLFLAAAFSFLRKDSLETLSAFLGWTGLSILALSIGLMLACVLVSAWVLWAREMMTPPDPESILRHVDLYLNADPAGPCDTSRENNLRDQARSWNTALKAQDKAITEKSKLLVLTQRLLIGGISTVVALLALSIYVYGSAPINVEHSTPSTLTPKETPHGKLP